MSKTIAIACAGSLGDLHPFLWLAACLGRRGHRIRFITQADHCRYVPEVYTVSALQPDLGCLTSELASRVFDPVKGVQHMICDLLLPALADSYQALLRDCKGVDLLITSELVYASALVAETLGTPYFSTVLAPMSLMSAYDAPVLPAVPWLAPLLRSSPLLAKTFYRAMYYHCRQWDKPVRALRQQLKLLPLSNSAVFEGKFSPTGTLALFSCVVGSPQPDWPINTCQVGFPLYRPADFPPMEAPLQQFLHEKSDKPLVVFTLGSAAVHIADTFYHISYQVAERLSLRALLLVGDQLPARRMTSDILAWPYAPYAQVFPYASMVVHQGGVGTTAQALRAACPMLIMPFAFDQQDNAERIRRLGAGLWLRHRQHYKLKIVTGLLSRLRAEPNFRHAAQRAACMLADEDNEQALITCLNPWL